MKVKIKITIDQFKWLTKYIERSVNYFEVGNITAINIRLFVVAAFKKLIDLRDELMINPNKVKTFPIEINQYIAILDTLADERNKLDPYTLAIFLTLQNQNNGILK